MTDCPSCLRDDCEQAFYWPKKNGVVYHCPCGNIWLAGERTPLCCFCAHPLDVNMLEEMEETPGYWCQDCQRFDSEGLCCHIRDTEYWCQMPTIEMAATGYEMAATGYEMEPGSHS